MVRCDAWASHVGLETELLASRERKYSWVYNLLPADFSKLGWELFRFCLSFCGLINQRARFESTSVSSCRYFQHAHFILIMGVGKRGEYQLVQGNLPRQHSFGTTLRCTGPMPADSRHRYAIAWPDKLRTDPMAYGGFKYINVRLRGTREESRK